MSVDRRQFMSGVAASVAGTVLAPGSSFAQAYPSRPIQFIVGNSAGSPPDTRVREVCEIMSRSIGQPIVVLNKPGAGSQLAARQVVAAPPDGYNLLSFTGNHLINEALRPEEDAVLNGLEPVTNFSTAPVILFVNPQKVKVKNAKEFVQYARANPDKLSYGTGGPGSIEQLNAKMLFGALGLRLTEVPYPAATRAIADILGGNVDVGFAYVLTIGQFVESGRLQAIGIATRERLPAAPNIPTLLEQGIDVPAVNAWQGLAVPKGTPPAIVSKLYQAAAAALRDPQLKERWIGQGAVLGGESPEVYQAFVKAQKQLIGDMVQKYGIKV